MAETNREDMILRLLREYRKDFDDLKNGQEAHAKSLEELNKRMEEAYETMYSTAGMAAHANIRHD